MAGRFLNPRTSAFDENGNPIAGAKLEFFVSGTTTQQATYSDDALTVVNPNPVIADSAGRFGDIFLLDADYKVVFSDADDVVIWTADPVRSEAQKSTVVFPVSTTTQLTVANDGNFVTADATVAGFVITLPAAADAGDGYQVTIQKIDSSTNLVTVDGSGSETINGASDLQLTEQYASAQFRCNGTTWFASAITATAQSVILPPNFLNGFGLTNNGSDTDHDIDIAVGSARSDDDTGNIALTSAFTKRLDAAFAEGSLQGGLDTGTIAANTNYFIYAIGKTDGQADVLFSISSTAPTLPSGFTLKRLIGAIRTDGSENIINDRFTKYESAPGASRFSSEAITISTGADADLDHNLLITDVAEMHRVRHYLKCLTAEDNYAIGDVLDLNAGQWLNDGSRGAALSYDATVLHYVLGNDGVVFRAMDATTGASVLLTNANWEYYVEAYA